MLEGTFEWAYAAMKTRTVSLDLDEADRAGSTLLVRIAGRDHGKELREESILPMPLRRRIQEMGVMVSYHQSIWNQRSWNTAQIVSEVKIQFPTDETYTLCIPTESPTQFVGACI